MRFLLDTNVLSEPMVPQPSRAVLSKLQLHAGQVCTSALCIHELIYGAERLAPSERKREYEEFLTELVEAIPVLPYDEDAARWHARERARLEARGKTPPFVDGQIAAIAATRDLILVTKNVRDFSDFAGVTVQNWAARR
jgi:tRNA(fMet)-specific endonuclease VapC